MELSSSLDLDEVLLSTARRLCSAMDVTGCYISTNVDDVTATCLIGLSEDSVDEGWTGRRFALADYPLLLKVVTTRRPAFFAPDGPELSATETVYDAPDETSGSSSR